MTADQFCCKLSIFVDIVVVRRILMIWRFDMFTAAMMTGALYSGLAESSPSFSCQASLNATERAICDSEELSRLDQDMVQIYLEIIDRGEEQSELAADQKYWLKSRNACGRRTDCIKQHYLERTSQLKSLSGSQSRPTRTIELKWTVLADGTLERRLSDGSRKLRFPNGVIETYLPDGSLYEPDSGAQAYEVQEAALPALPGEFTNWGLGLEGSLLVILRNILTDEEMATYLQTEKDKSFYQLIEWRIDSILFLTREPS